MTKTDHNPFSAQTKDDLVGGVASGHHCAPIPISFEQSIEAYQLAIESTDINTFEDLILSGTWQKYEMRAASIARKHPSRNPFTSFLAFDANDAWKNANSRQSYRSALVKMAARDVLELARIHWWQMLKDVKNENDQVQIFRRLEPLLCEDTRRQMSRVERRLSDDQRGLLSQATTFLLQVPPDPHHTSLRTRQTEEDRGDDPRTSRSSASKKSTLVALNRHQRRKARSFPNYDWRSHFWTMAVIPDEHLGGYPSTINA